MTVFDFAMAAVHDLVLLMFAALTVLGCYLRDNFKQRLKYPLCSQNIQSIKYYMPRIRLYIMNVLVKYQIKFGCLIVSLLTTKVIDRLCSTLYTAPP